MRKDPLIEAALLDQTRRILQTAPAEFGRRSRRVHDGAGTNICEVCGGWLQGRNKYGVCSRTTTCCAERQRRMRAR